MKQTSDSHYGERRNGLAVFRDVATRSLVEFCRRFRGAYRLHHQDGIALKINPKLSSSLADLAITKETWKSPGHELPSKPTSKSPSPLLVHSSVQFTFAPYRALGAAYFCLILKSRVFSFYSLSLLA
jgi:hypothetical protein